MRYGESLDVRLVVTWGSFRGSPGECVHNQWLGVGTTQAVLVAAYVTTWPIPATREG